MGQGSMCGCSAPNVVRTASPAPASPLNPARPDSPEGGVSMERSSTFATNSTGGGPLASPCRSVFVAANAAVGLQTSLSQWPQSNETLLSTQWTEHARLSNDRRYRTAPTPPPFVSMNPDTQERSEDTNLPLESTNAQGPQATDERQASDEARTPDAPQAPDEAQTPEEAQEPQEQIEVRDEVNVGDIETRETEIDVTPVDGVNAYAVADINVRGGGGGQADRSGNLYIADGGRVRIFDVDQREIGSFNVPSGAVDVAPAPDGSSAFVVSRVGNHYEIKRFAKSEAGNWGMDSNFALEQFPYGGKLHTAEGMRIATDAHGNLFVADGVWSSNSLNTVVKFDSNGRYVTRFGEYVEGNATDASSWQQGRFYWSLGGIAVSPDGTSVYTTEVGNNRVQRWDVQEDGTYESTKMWGSTQETDPTREGSLEPGRFAAPYDIGIDQWGDVYVLNTTGAQIQKFTPDGDYLLSMDVGRLDDATIERAHGLAVDARGNAVSTETGKMMRRTEPDLREIPALRDAPRPDLNAPTLRGVSVPEFADTERVTIEVDAEDDRAVKYMRVANEDGAWGEWIAFSPTLEVTLTAGAGVKGIYVQVADNAGNESAAIYHTLLRRL